MSLCNDVADTIQDFVQEDEFQVFAEIIHYVLTTETALKPNIIIGRFLERRNSHHAHTHVVKIRFKVSPDREIEEIVFNGHYGYNAVELHEFYGLPTQTVCYNLAKICMEGLDEYQKTSGLDNWSREPVKFEFHRKRLEGPAGAIMQVNESVFEPELERKIRSVLSENDLEAIDTLYPIFKDHLMGLVGETETRTAPVLCHKSRH